MAQHDGLATVAQRQQDATVAELRTLGSSSTAAAALSLPALFSACERLLTGAGRDAVLAAAQKEPQLLLDASALLEEATDRVEAAGVFSGNEDADDISTQDLKYLLLPAIKAELLTLAPPTPIGDASTVSTRLRAVVGAIAEYSRFLSQAAGQYNLAGDAGRRLLELEEDADDISATSSTAAVLRGGGCATGADPNSRRLAKVEKFKREKALQAQLAQLEQQRQRRVDLEQDHVEGGSVGGPQGFDEEDERQLWLLRIEGACLHAVASRQLLRDELRILRHAHTTEQRAGGAGGATATSGGSRGGGVLDGRQRPRTEDVERAMRQAETATMVQQLRAVASNLDGGKREQIRQQVLRPGHTLPTMTIEEFAEIETADMMRRQVAEQASTKAQREHEEAVGSDDEEAVMVQRAKDDWKDANPFGSGNSKLKPCG